MKQLIVESLRLLTVLISFIIIATFTQLFTVVGLNVQHYIVSLAHLAGNLIHIYDFHFQIAGGFIERKLFPFIIQPWLNTMKIFILALIIAIVLSFLMIAIAKRVKWLNWLMTRIVRVLGYLPDIFIMPIVILLVILTYKHTGLLVIDVASTVDKDIILLPAVLLSIVPFVQFYKILDQAIEEERSESYVMTAKGKGLSETEILIKHIMPNIASIYYINFRQVVWMTLSSLFVMEILFGIFGATSFLYTYHQPEIILTVLILMFIPLYMMFIGLKFFIERFTGVSL
ncbi:ABC transporter permease subunit [Macrococcus equipercicus]|uniref:ABC transporter permease subunit n=1 Tax=Macrococcus equipercicus TaxID=69967 RepID=A0A9Q9BU65_9STAP|nr:ABC transporter permease subunit [Macrococcus equipercicus]UTH14136.1 ABC transporter permease subunit [Macrococcus equipercicus]